ncbi:germinal-center associated nuclear protein [Phlebotomus argentipes]|uniref:germinal-center associated nuclear protein n=1 Tax=Phlebotomus argentipes TaxID=94469 RepID=UPI0028933D7C|nr:germinal-center associated nuclear protein [Phlebotomus argentipes]
MDFFVEGICEKMCTEKEINLRIREKLVHFFEKNPKTGGVDKARMVRAFARSAAGKECTARDLRTVSALKQTVSYLLTEILPDKRKPFHEVFDFIFDRMRSVRQEIVMQNISPIDTLALIEPMIFFMVYSRYRLCEEPLMNFDPKICRQHMIECVQTALVCYDESHERLENRPIVESVYLLANLGNQDALRRGLSVFERLHHSSVFLTAFKMSLYSWKGNYYRTLAMWSDLPTICCLAAAEKIPDIRGKLLETFSVSYHSRQLTVPLAWLQKILRYGDRCHLEQDLRRCSVEIVNRTDARFDKAAFDKRGKILLHSHEAIVEEKLTAEPLAFPI